MRSRRLRIALLFALFAFEILWLAFQPVQSAPKAVYRAGMKAQVRQEEHMLTFTLTGHPPDLDPALRVLAGQTDLTDYLRFREQRGGDTSIRLSYTGVAKYPAQVLSYTWTVGQEQLSGEYMYISPGFDYSWRFERRGPFAYYHTGNLAAASADQWTEHYLMVGRYLGMEPIERVFYLMPNQEALQKALGSDPLIKEVAGLWSGTLNAVLVAPNFPPQTLRRILFHEFAHAYLWNRNPIWWEEGIATWVEAMISRADQSVPHPQLITNFQRLTAVMKAEPIALIRINHSQAAPLDPYTVGYSYCLYLAGQVGESGVVRLATLATQVPLREAVEQVVGRPFDDVETEWQEWVRTGAHLQALTGR